MLERGQKLDELVDKTDKLSGTSKAFYKEVYIYMQCCILHDSCHFYLLSLSLSLSRLEVELVVLYNDVLIFRYHLYMFLSIVF